MKLQGYTKKDNQNRRFRQPLLTDQKNLQFIPEIYEMNYVVAKSKLN